MPFEHDTPVPTNLSSPANESISQPCSTNYYELARLSSGAADGARPVDVAPFATYFAQLNLQRKLLLAGVVIFVALGLFPPWKFTNGTNRERPGGYAFIALPPESNWSVRIDVTRLIVQWLVVAAAVGAAVVLTKPRQQVSPHFNPPDKKPFA